MGPEHIVLTILHWAILVSFAVVVVFAARHVFARRNTHNAWLLPFAYFSFGSWVFWVLQYLILVSQPLISFPSGILQYTSLWLGVMQNTLWVSAVLSLYSKLFYRVSLTLPPLGMFSILIGLAIIYQTSVLTSVPLIIIGAVLVAAIFTVLGLSITRLEVSKLFAATFFIHGFSQWIWHYLGEGQLQLVAWAFWYVALLGAWWALISEMLVTSRVMISSTVTDLTQEREVVDRAIRNLRLEGFRSEKIGSRPYTPKALCALWAEQCHIFILIIGERYGFVIRSLGISVVEFEFQVASAQNPHKILVYVKDGVTREPRLEEFLQRLEDFEEGYFRSLFTTPEDLYEAIQRDVAEWLTRRRLQA
jgi:Domain of unknown function (DUF4062)